MKSISNRVRVGIFTLLMLVGAVGVNAQTPRPTPPVGDPVLTACEEIADKAKRLEIERDSYKAQLDIEKERTANAKEATDNARKEAAFWEKAANAGTKIDNNSEQIIFQLRSQVADDRVRITELEQENKSLRSSRTTRTWLGFGAGFGLGYYTKSKF